MKNTFLTLTSLVAAIGLWACGNNQNQTKETSKIQSAEQVEKEKVKSDLLVIVSMNDYTEWKKNGFDADSERRAAVCNEDLTKVAKVSDTKALVLMYDVDVEGMMGVMTEEVMKELMKKFGAKHEMFFVQSPEEVGKPQPKENVLVKVTMDDYDSWRRNAFDKDAERRATVCSETKTLVGKFSDNEAYVAMFDVDMQGMSEFMTEEAMSELKRAFGAEHTMSFLRNPQQ